MRTRAQYNEVIFSWIVKFISVITILLIIGIFVTLFKEVIPLFYSQNQQLHRSSDVSHHIHETPLFVGLDDFVENMYFILPNAEIVVTNLDGKKIAHYFLDEDITLAHHNYLGQEQHFACTTENECFIFSLHFQPTYPKNSSRIIVPQFQIIKKIVSSYPTVPLEQQAAFDNDGNQILLTHIGEKEFIFQSVVTETNFLGQTNETQILQNITSESPSKITHFLLDNEATKVFFADEDGYLELWEIYEGKLEFIYKERIATSAIRNIAFIAGNNSLLVDSITEPLKTITALKNKDNNPYFLINHTFQKEHDEVKQIVFNERYKSFLVLYENGFSEMFYLTSEKKIMEKHYNDGIQSINFNPRGKELITFYDGGKIEIWNLRIPHPEASLSTLFSKTLYEGYQKPDYIWQSSASDEVYEPKLSLSVLIFGSIKGTMYAMLFAVPLSIFGAIYLNQCLSNKSRKIIKSMIEILAAIPSVVIGFLAALWLAPFLENHFFSFFLFIITFPLLFTALLFGLLRWTLFQKINGKEWLFIMPVFILCGIATYYFSAAVETTIFQGDFNQWLFSVFDIKYEQRNSIIIAFALGFAVIPLMFSLIDDALTSIPKSLSAASLALGANHWQTISRVILPSASSGIIAAFIIGFGRAIGETMIVLMATGNTPILDWSIFNGMRTLSANIAVEIPEAPVGGTLYRVLFLSAFILFFFNFILNSFAEVIRQSLRKKYGHSR